MTNILLVEPDQQSQLDFTDIVKGSRFELKRRTDNGQEALELHDEVDPDLTVLAFRTPFGRWESSTHISQRISLLLSKLYERDPYARVLMTVQPEDTRRIEQLSDADPLPVLEKPFTENETLVLVAKAIDREAKRKGYRRDAIRIDREIPVHFTKESDWFFTRRSGVTEDISATGLALTCDETLDPGDRIDLEIELPGKQPIKASGVVRWASDQAERSQVGIEFHELDDDSQESIRQFVISTASKSQIHQIGRNDPSSVTSDL